MTTFFEWGKEPMQYVLGLYRTTVKKCDHSILAAHDGKGIHIDMLSAVVILPDQNAPGRACIA